MTIKQQGGIFGRNPTFNDVNATNVDTTNAYVNKISVGTDFQIEPVTLLRTTGNNANNPVIAVSAGAVDKYATIDVYRGSSSSQIGWTFNTMYGSLAEAFTVTPSGNIAFPSGQGIDFSATSGTGTSELFDDYEEGTWTPTFANGYTAGSTSGTYTKIGNTVSVTLRIVNIGTSGASGFLKITGLPYTPSEDSYNGDFVIRTDFNQTSGAIKIAPVASSAGYISLYQSFNDPTSFAIVTDANFTGGGLTDLNLSMTYFAS